MPRHSQSRSAFAVTCGTTAPRSLSPSASIVLIIDRPPWSSGPIHAERRLSATLAHSAASLGDVAGGRHRETVVRPYNGPYVSCGGAGVRPCETSFGQVLPRQ